MQAVTLPSMVFIVLVIWCIVTEPNNARANGLNIAMAKKSSRVNVAARAGPSTMPPKSSKSSKSTYVSSKSAVKSSKAIKDTGPKETTVFRVQTGNGVNTATAWKFGGEGTTNNASCISCTESGCSEHYRSDLLDQWETLGISRVRYSIYKDCTEVKYVLFNGTSSTFTNWFSLDRVIESSYTDIVSYYTPLTPQEALVVFALAFIQPPLFNFAAFAMLDGDCGEFAHFLTIEEFDDYNCPYQIARDYPYIWYNTGSTAALAEPILAPLDVFDFADTAIVTIEY